MRRPLAIAAALVAGALVAGAADDAAPLRDEDVVRAWVSGTPVDALVETIRAAETDFDLSDDMLAELRNAGLPAALIDAMIARQAEIDAANAPPPAPEPAAPAGTTIRVALTAGDGDGDGPAALRLVNALDEPTAGRLGVPPDERLIDDVAVFVACRTADHVPDQWRSVSPLGRDFVSMPRHGMLAFVSGASSEPAPAAGLQRRLAQTLRIGGEQASSVATLRLDLPASIDVAVEPGVAHDLVVGLAVHTSDRWLALSLGEAAGVVVEDGDAREVRATVSAQRPPVAATTRIDVAADD